MLWAVVATVANGMPMSNDQMQIYQTFVLCLAGITAWFILGVAWGLSASVVAVACLGLSGLQLACTLLWRYHRYNAEMWLVAWITGLVLLWWSSRVTVPPLADQHT